MKNLLLIIFLSGVFTLQAQQTVHLKGKLVGMGSQVVKMSYDGATSLIGKDGDFMIRTDAEGNFDTILPLTKPAFYRISRNTLYLTPGDDMEVYITPRNKEAIFKGEGAEVNTYMKGRLFPKGGSFLGEFERERKGGFQEIKKSVDSLAQLRAKELKKVKKGSEAFKDLENARIIADIANSYLAYPWYCSPEPIETEEGYNAFIKQIAPEVVKLVEKVIDDRYLDVAVVRDVIGTAMAHPELNATLNFPLRTQELFKTGEYAYRLDKEINSELIAEVQRYAEGLKNADIKKVLDAKLASVSALQKGKPAIDIELHTPEGNIAHLSDYKGKVIYVDLWATWCGPCVQESPKFHELSKKYAGENIVFLAVSKDTNKKAWLKFIEGKESGIPEYNCTDTENLDGGWQVKYIPRFLLIDENFRIIDAFAPLPSQPEAVEMIDKALKK